MKVGDKNQEATVIAWLWARTVKCSNPICNHEIPLVNSFVISSAKGKQAWINPIVTEDGITYKIEKGKPEKEPIVKLGKGANFQCLSCGEVTDKEYVHSAFENKKVGASLIGIVAEGPNGRVYLSADKMQEEIALSVDSDSYGFMSNLKMDENTPNLVSGRGYGISKWSELFTNRQLLMLTTLSDCLQELKETIISDSKNVIHNIGTPLADGGSDARAYAEAILVYLSFVIDKMADYNSSFCSWHSSGQKIRNVFGRQAIPMVWDYAETNPFSGSSGSYDNMMEWVVKVVQAFPKEKHDGEVVQWDATQDNSLRNIMVSTDPPYYDNIEYSSLSDFFYIWLRHSLKDIYPSLFSTVLTPKANELVAFSFRQGSDEDAKDFFEDGMSLTCNNLYKYSREDIPVTIYYAFKQSDTDDEGTASSGWETMLTAIIKAGFSITGTWPMRTEMVNRNVASESNALATSIVIVCRKNKENKTAITMKNFMAELRKELVPAIQKLQSSNIAPVDLAQSAIGPGIAVYSRYKEIIQADDSSLSVRDALKLINKELDEILNDHDSDMDTESSLCLTLFTQYGYNECAFGDANTLANAKNISVDALSRIGIVESGKGKVRVLERSEIKPFNSTSKDNVWLLTQQAVKAYEDKGYSGIAEVFADIDDSMSAKIKKLCYQLYSIADRKKWTEEALIYNSVITSWDDAVSAVSDIRESKKEAVQLEFDLEG